jgi:plasmid stabilization system protein ParE
MEKEIVWTIIAEKDFWQIVSYLKENWPASVLEHFQRTLLLKTRLLQKQPRLGFKSSKYSRFRKTLITRYYLLIYSVTQQNIVIHRLKHTSLNH